MSPQPLCGNSKKYPPSNERQPVFNLICWFPIVQSGNARRACGKLCVLFLSVDSLRSSELATCYQDMDQSVTSGHWSRRIIPDQHLSDKSRELAPGPSRLQSHTGHTHPFRCPLVKLLAKYLQNRSARDFSAIGGCGYSLRFVFGSHRYP